MGGSNAAQPAGDAGSERRCAVVADADPAEHLGRRSKAQIVSGDRRRRRSTTCSRIQAERIEAYAQAARPLGHAAHLDRRARPRDPPAHRRGAVRHRRGRAEARLGAAAHADRPHLLDDNGMTNPIRVEGNTDNVPISTSAFPSNWELSTARADAVVLYLISNGVAARAPLRRRLRRPEPDRDQRDRGRTRPQPPCRDRRPPRSAPLRSQNHEGQAQVHHPASDSPDRGCSLRT